MPRNDNPLALVRALRGAPLTCLFALSLAGEPAQVRRVCEMTGYSHKTAAAALQALAELGLAAHDGQHSQWRLAPPAGDLLQAGSAAQNPAGDPAGRPPSTRTEAAARPEAAANPLGRSLGGKFSSPSGKIYDSKVKAIAKAYPTSISLSIIKRESALTANRPGQAPPRKREAGREAVRKILAATRDLFGERVLGRPSQYPDVQLLLGWIAQAYDHRDRLRKPARVVYAGLKNLEEPERRYLRNPWAFLPDDFRQRVGEERGEASRGDREFGEAQDGEDGDWEAEQGWEAGDEEVGEEAGEDAGEGGYAEAGEEAFAEDGESQAAPVEADSVRLAANPNGTMTAKQAWQIALDLLRREMPRSAFEQNVRDAVLVDFDPVAGVFRAAAGNDYLRRWLKDRLTSTLVRMLCGICDRQVQVEFVVVGPGD